ncbi:MAG: hypothetical protein ACRCZF_11625 [Gemmataceae bacterium]
MARWVLLILVLLTDAAAARAGWITIQNDTTEPIIVQEICVVNQKTRYGKPVKLLPGEKLREYQAAPGTKTFQLLEPGILINKVIGKTEITWQAADEPFRIQKDATQTKIASAKPPVPTPTVTTAGLTTEATVGKSK